MNCSGTVRINPIGALLIGVVIILIVYFNFGNNNIESISAYRTVSLKSLLVASVEIAKRGGAEVKAIREQVIIFFCTFRTKRDFL